MVKICKINNIDMCEGGLQLADIATKNLGKNDLNPRMKDVVAMLEKRDKKLIQEGWQDTG